MVVRLIAISALVIPGIVLAAVLGVPQTGPESARVATKRFTMRVVTSGLGNPWEITWGPDGKLWVTERTALRIVRVDPVTGERHVAASLEGLAKAAGPGGVLGMALHPQLLRNAGHDEVYVAVTYDDPSRPPDARVADASSPFRHLYAKVIRLRYEPSTFALVDPVTILDGLPAGNDHSGLRLKFAPDGTLHLTIGDQGNNQLGNVCNPVLSQQLPTQAEVDRRDWSAYEGKTLRITVDGGIPADNPVLNGVRSHVYTYGHRNPQGLTVGPDGALYTSDHGPKTDDEVNVLAAGGNYGWPHVAGLRDDRAYQYARWADATTPCASLRFSDLAIPASVPREAESAFSRADDGADRHAVHGADRPRFPGSRLRRRSTSSAGRRSRLRASSRTPGTRTASPAGIACSSCRRSSAGRCTWFRSTPRAGAAPGRSRVRLGRRTAIATRPSIPTAARSSWPPTSTGLVEARGRRRLEAGRQRRRDPRLHLRR